jgi:prolyl-tRNA editing enzyme YbaK/EbsC (Cys-tRNA(Pro) deacylase)
MMARHGRFRQRIVAPRGVAAAVAPAANHGQDAPPPAGDTPPMSLESVRRHLAEAAPDVEILVLDASTATVAMAAAGHGVETARIAKTLSLRQGERVFLLVVGGDARLDNRKAKAAFGGKVSMLSADEVEAATGHPVGGVCPFGLARPLPVYCDVSLKAFDEVVPAAGAVNAAVRIAPERMADLAGATWVDVCSTPMPA